MQLATVIYRSAMPEKFRASDIPKEQRGDGDRLRAALKGVKKKQIDLARRVGVSGGAVGQWLSEERQIPEDRLLEIARFCRTQPEKISPALARTIARKGALLKSLSSRSYPGSPGDPASVQDSPSLEQAQIRGIATMTAHGSWQWTEMLPAEGSVPWNRPGCYALRVIGDAMHPRYKSGEYLIVREDAPIDPDCDVLVVLKDGTAMIREIASIRDGRVALSGPAGARLTVERSKIELLHRVVGRSDASEVDA